MQVFIYKVRIPDQVWEERNIEMITEKPSDILYWTVQELDRYYSGEFGWKKMGLIGVCAFQYINPKLVRMIVNAKDREVADAMVKSFSWHLDAKKFHKRRYSTKRMRAVV